MKKAFQTTTIIAIFSLALLVFSSPALALSGTLTVNPTAVAVNSPYSFEVRVAAAADNLSAGTNVQIFLEETTTGQPANIGSPQTCSLSSSQVCQAVFSIKSGKPAIGIYAYRGKIMNPTTGIPVLTNGVAVTVGATGGTPGTTGRTPGTPEQLPGEAPSIVQTGAQLIETIGRIGDWAFLVLIAVASVFLIVAGFLWITAAGEPQNLEKARQMLINSLVGVVIALVARGLVQVVRSILGG